MRLEQGQGQGQQMRLEQGQGQGQQKKMKSARAGAARARAADGAESSCAIDIEENLRPSIFRVPDFLKKSKTEAYVPNRVSLGPYHSKLQLMHDKKEEALRRVKGSGTAIDFVDEERKIKDSYEEEIIDDSKTLSLMLSLDCCFFLETLTTCQSEKVAETDEPKPILFDTNKIEHTGLDILQDFLKLENQIPMIVVRKILQLKLNTRSADDVNKHLVALYGYIWSKVCPFHKENVSKSEKLHKIEESHHLLHWLHTLIAPHSENGEGTASSNAGHTDPKQSHHPLDWLHTFFGFSSKSQNVEGTRNAGYTSIPSEAEAPDSSITTEADAPIPGEADDSGNEVISIHHARELRRAGINFIPCKIKKIRFDKKSANLYLPPITVDDFTETLLRNLIAFEMCQPSEIHYVSRYVSLMDDLIDSAEDVALLRSKNIITNYLGSNREIAELFNGLCKGVTDSKKDPFQELKQEVKNHYGNKIYIWYADLVNEHFSTPWKCLALAGAIILLLLTVLQTIFSILSVCK